jgi:hypothetical protein
LTRWRQRSSSFSSDLRAQGREGLSWRKPDVYSMDHGRKWAVIARLPDDRPHMKTSQ